MKKDEVSPHFSNSGNTHLSVYIYHISGIQPYVFKSTKAKISVSHTMLYYLHMALLEHVLYIYVT